MTAWLENPAGRRVVLGQGQRRNEVLVFNSSARPPNGTVSLNYSLLGEGADLHLLIIFLDDAATTSPERMEIDLQIDHRAPRTRARATMRAIMNGRQSLNFPATVFVPATAGQTDTHLRCDALMLREGSFFRPMPALEILANDVKAGHAASSAPPDEESLFFLRTRGLSEKEARNMLIEAFLNHSLDGMAIKEGAKIEQLQEKISGLSRYFVL